MRPALTFAVMLFPSTPVLAQKAHVHGTAELRLAIDGGVVEAELALPAKDVVGFEYAPRDEADEAAIAGALEALEAGVALIGISPAAECLQSRFDVVASPGGATADGHEDHGHDDKAPQGEEHREGGHSEFVLRYRFDCATPEAITAIQPTLFAAFPSVGAIDVQALTAMGQAAGRLTPARPGISF